MIIDLNTKIRSFYDALFDYSNNKPNSKEIILDLFNLENHITAFYEYFKFNMNVNHLKRFLDIIILPECKLKTSEILKHLILFLDDYFHNLIIFNNCTSRFVPIQSNFINNEISIEQIHQFAKNMLNIDFTNYKNQEN